MIEEKEVSVAELKELYATNEYDIEIETPDGFQRIINWFNKGILPTTQVKTKTETTVCADNHMLQNEDMTWTFAKDVCVGDKLITKTGVEEVMFVASTDDEECYDFEVAHENHRYWGDGFSSHNSGKSFIAAGNLIREAQKKDVFIVLIDSENALDESWLHKLGVDTAEDKLMKLNMAMINDVAKVTNEFITSYKADYAGLPDEEKPKVLFVVDSLGMLQTPIAVDQFTSGNMKGDFGHKPKALKALVTNLVNMIGEHPIGLVGTNHSYASQDMFQPDPVISGGCLTKDHKVQLADDSLKCISEMEIGDFVKTMNGPREVLETFEFNDKEVFELELSNGSTIQATGNHKFLVEDGEGTKWVKVEDLNEDDEILEI